MLRTRNSEGGDFQFELGNGMIKIDFTNVPVMKSLLEAKHDQ